MNEKAPGRYWFVRHPDSQGNIVAKIDSPDDEIPDKIANYDGFVVHQAADVSELDSLTADASGLTDAEADRIRTRYPEVDQFR